MLRAINDLQFNKLPFEPLHMSKERIQLIVNEIYSVLYNALGNRFGAMIVYGSCARGDFNNESDIDIALILKGDRDSMHDINSFLTEVAAAVGLAYGEVISFICIPEEEYTEKKHWYPFYNNIYREGIVLDGHSTL